ncbi:hypothetical protein JHL18_25005 [Clostridium sp. YIM B02505]|uniref:Dockerin domain-containing protein n=1 Tax=Clostridium yunnanense TaxID=2800325 RepID=A0ABS1EX24_9CLOT|nr:hypothetical protein [Clostridium yunnanense]MBK1813869.1 hypothetical protein [Clostridium yunnanense]
MKKKRRLVSMVLLNIFTFVNVLNGLGVSVFASQNAEIVAQKQVEGANIKDDSSTKAKAEVKPALNETKRVITQTILNSEADSVTVRIMNPFDTSKPLANGNIVLKGDDQKSYTTNQDGYANLPKSKLQADNTIIIKVDNGSAATVFSTSVDLNSSSPNVSISNTSLSKINIKPYIPNQYAVDISNMNIQIFNMEQYSNIVFKLDSSGQKTLYTNLDISGATVSGNNIFLTNAYSGKGDFEINNFNVFNIKVNMLAENSDDLRFLNLVGTRLLIGDYHIKTSGNYTLSRGSYMYEYTGQKYLYTGKFDTLNGTKSELKFGSIFNTAIQYEDKENQDEVNVDDTITTKLMIKDEYDNEVDPLLTTSVSYAAIINGVEESMASVTVAGDNIYKVKVGRRDDTKDFIVGLKITMDNKQYTTNTLTYKYNTNVNRKKIMVKDPEGNLMKNGKIESSSVNSINGTVIDNGEMYIDQEILKSGVKDVSIHGTNTKGEEVIYTSLSLDSNTIEIYSNSEKKIYIKNTLREDIGSISFSIYSKSSDKSNPPIYSEGFNLKQDYTDKFNDKYVWVPNNANYITLDYYDGTNDTQQNYFLIDRISTSDTVNLDYTKTTKLNINGNNQMPVSLNYKIDGFYIASRIYDPSTFTRNVTSDMCEGYKVNAGDIMQGVTYNKELDNKISGSEYTINLGNAFNVKADYLASKFISADKVGKASIDITDEFNNKVYLNRFDDQYRNDIDLVEITQNGQVVESLPCNLKRDKLPYEFDFTTKVQGGYLDVVFKVNIFYKMYSSNVLTYDNTGCKEYTIKDPTGALLESGEIAAEDGSKYKIEKGKALVPIDKSLGKTASIYGKTKDGEYVLNPRLSINGEQLSLSLLGTKKAIVTNAKDIANVSNGEFKLYCADQYSDYYIDEMWDNNSLNSISNLKVWLQPGVQYRVSNFINTNGDSQYLLTKSFGDDVSNITLGTDKLVELKVSSAYENANLNVNVQQDNVQTNTKPINMAKKTFITENQLKCLEASYVDQNDSTKNVNYKLADNEIMKGKQHTILLGNKFKPYCTYTNNKVLFYGDIIVAADKGLKDEYNNYKSDAKGSSLIELEFIDDTGKVIKTTSRFSLIGRVPTTIPTGKYSVRTNVYVNDEKVFSNTINDVYVAGASAIKIKLSQYSYNIKFYDESNLIYSNSYNKGGNIYIPNYLLESGKHYNYSLLDSDNGVIEHIKSDFLLDGTSQTNVTTKASVNLKVSNNVKRLILTTSDGQSIDYDTADHSTKSTTLSLVEGEQYNISAYCEDSNGSYWSKKVIKVDKNMSEVNFNKDSLKKVSLVNKFNNSVEIIGCTAKDTTTGQSYNLGRDLDEVRSLYLPVGKYELNFKVRLNDSNILNDYNTNIDLSQNDNSINIGSNLSYDIVLDKSIYSSGEKISAKLVNVKDGDNKLSGYENLSLDSSSLVINLMHGMKIIKSFNGTIPTQLKGDCSIKVKASLEGLGVVEAKPINIVVNNSGSIKEGDINLDGVVDIFDIIYVARDFGKIKGQNDYDPRVNLDSSDTVIDVKDLARAAVNYGN